MRPRALIAFVILTLLVAAIPASAQLAEVQPGARVRLAAAGVVAGTLTGTVLSRGADSIVIGSPESRPVVVPIARITSLELSRGNSRMAGAVRGMVWGAPTGLVIGLTSLSGAGCDGRTNNCFYSTSERNELTLLSTLAGTIWGAGIGAIVGREQWATFDLRATPVVGSAGVGLSVSLTR